MIFIVYISEGVIGFVCHELPVLLDYIRKNSVHKVETRNGSRLGAVQWFYN